MPSARSSASSTSLCFIATSPSSTMHAHELQLPSRHENGASTPLDSRNSSSTCSPFQSSNVYCWPSSSTSSATGPANAGSSASPSSSASSAAAMIACAASTSSTSPNGLPPSETNFSWWRRSRGNSRFFSAVATAFMNGAGPQQNAVYVMKYDAKFWRPSSVGRPWTDSSQCTTVNLLAYSVARAASSPAKITESWSR